MAQMHDVGRYTTPPETQHLEALAREAYAEIPEELRQALGDVVIRVLDFPDDETLEEMDCERSEEHTSELQSLMRISYAVFCLKKKKHKHRTSQYQMIHRETTNKKKHRR